MTNIQKAEQNQSAPWRCNVYLMKSFYFDGSKPKSGRSRRTSPWHRQNVEEIFFASTNERQELCGLIARAQAAILNPGEDHRIFLHHTFVEDGHRENVKFSPNVIRLDIYSDDVADLSLFDLPGVISVPESEDERYLVDLVEDLVKSYVKSRASINLLALPMNNDSANSKAANLIQRYGDKERTIGVLTKPDLYQRTESFQQWLDILQGRKFSFGHGYFVVCNAADVNVDHGTARKAEHDFFQGEPWVTMPLTKMAHRFGTHNLAAELQHLLEDQIRQNLPTIREKINSAVVENQANLSRLPPRRTNSAAVVIAQNLSTFKYDLQALFSTSSTSYPFRKLWNQIAQKFRSVLEQSRPRMKIRTKIEEANLQKRGRLNTPITPMKANENHQVIELDSEPDQNMAAGSKRKREGPWAACNGIGMEFYLDDIRKISLDTYSSNVPDLLNPKAIEFLNQQCVQHWDIPLKVFHKQLARLLHDVIEEIARRAFDEHGRDSRVYQAAMQRIAQFLEDVLDRQANRNEDLLEIEFRVPYTTNEVAMRREKDSAWQVFQTARNNQRRNDLNEDQESPRKTKTREEVLPPDEFAKEIEMIAVRASILCSPIHD